MSRRFWPCMAAALTLLAGAVATTARAEQFLGEERTDSDDTTQDKSDNQNSAKPKSDKKKHAAAPAADTERSHSDLSFAGGIGAGDGYLDAQLTVGYGFNRWVGIDTTAYYYRLDSNGSSGEMYGPEVDLVLRGANPTMLTPFVGAGPGYYRWSRRYAGVAFDQAGSFTGNAFFGLDIALTKHFGLQLERKQQTYLNTPPKSFVDRVSPEARTTLQTLIGFRATF